MSIGALGIMPGELRQDPFRGSSAGLRNTAPVKLCDTTIPKINVDRLDSYPNLISFVNQVLHALPHGSNSTLNCLKEVLSRGQTAAQ